MLESLASIEVAEARSPSERATNRTRPILKDDGFTRKADRAVHRPAIRALLRNASREEPVDRLAESRRKRGG